MSLIGVATMAKRGRPKSIGKTKTIRLPNDLYTLILWVSDARRMDSSSVASVYLREPIIQLFLSLLEEIKQRKAAEDKRAKIEGTTSLPLPRIRIHLPYSLHQPPQPGRHRSTKVLWADEIDPVLLTQILNYRGKGDPWESADHVHYSIIMDDGTPPSNDPNAVAEPDWANMTAEQVEAYEQLIEARADMDDVGQESETGTESSRRTERQENADTPTAERQAGKVKQKSKPKKK